MPGRKFNGGDYRYGFNGKENDNEIKGEGNSVDFGARMYDPRLGRWQALDPLASKYPNQSPYNFVANSPIVFVDPDGRVIRWAQDEESQKAKKEVLKLVNSSKIYAYVYNRLEENLKVYNVSVNYDLVQKMFQKHSKDSTGVAGGFASKKTGRIVFATSNDREAFSEEFFYQFQYLVYEGKEDIQPQLDSEAKIFNQVVLAESDGRRNDNSEDPYYAVQTCMENQGDFIGPLESMNNGLILDILL